MEFVCELYLEQIKAGRLFLHEHPAAATSWSLQEIQNIMRGDGVHTVAFMMSDGDNLQLEASGRAVLGDLAIVLESA